MNDDGPERLRRSDIAGSDFDEARQMLQDEYNGGGFSVEPSSPEFSYRYSSVGDDELTLRGSLFGGSVRGSIQTDGEYIVQWITAGEGALDLDGDAIRLEHGRPAMFANGRPSEFDFRDYRQSLMHFDGAYLERVAAEHEGVTGPLLFDTRSQPSGVALRRWAATVATVARVVHDRGSSDLVRSEANRTAAVALLETFPHTALTTSIGTDLPANRTLRAAIEHIHANAHLPLRTEDVARSVDVSLRSLQALFRRELDLTPIEYLRHVRLDRVRDELRASGSDTATVGEIAQRWGFAHLGRFAASYAERFGERPRATLDGV